VARSFYYVYLVSAIFGVAPCVPVRETPNIYLGPAEGGKGRTFARSRGRGGRRGWGRSAATRARAEPDEHFEPHFTTDIGHLEHHSREIVRFEPHFTEDVGHLEPHFTANLDAQSHISGTRGSSGLGSVSSDESESRTCIWTFRAPLLGRYTSIAPFRRGCTFRAPFHGRCWTFRALFRRRFTFRSPFHGRYWAFRAPFHENFRYPEQLLTEDTHL
jgi:hypothetical protein